MWAYFSDPANLDRHVTDFYGHLEDTKAIDVESLGVSPKVGRGLQWIVYMHSVSGHSCLHSCTPQSIAMVYVVCMHVAFALHTHYTRFASRALQEFGSAIEHFMLMKRAQFLAEGAFYPKKVHPPRFPPTLVEKHVLAAPQVGKHVLARLCCI